MDKMKTVFAHLQKYRGGYLLIIVVFFLILWFPNRAINRYAISNDSKNSMTGMDTLWIVDTRTGQTWLKTIGGVVDLGTNDNPTKLKDLDTANKVERNK